MKRALSIALAVGFLFAFACNQPGKVSTHPGQSGQGKMYSGPDPTQTLGANEKGAAIKVITLSGDGKCRILDPGEIELKKGVEKVSFITVYYGPYSGVTVIIDDFRDLKESPPKFRNPFGDHSDAQNRFSFGPLDSGKPSTPLKSKEGTTEGYYYYRIIVLGRDGVVLCERDPGVIITG